MADELFDDDNEPHVVGVSRPISPADAEPLRTPLPHAGAPRHLPLALA